MSLAAAIAVALLALLHVYILVLEMFLWDTPMGRRAFNLEPEFARATRTMAANQGLYNGFLAAGLFWGLAARGNSGHALTLFFVGCVLVAGLFGGFTANRKIFLVQAAPATVTLLLVLLT